MDKVSRATNTLESVQKAQTPFRNIEVSTVGLVHYFFVRYPLKNGLKMTGFDLWASLPDGVPKRVLIFRQKILANSGTKKTDVKRNA
jgi:hypothetical protein